MWMYCLYRKHDGKEQRQGAWEKDIRSDTAVVTAKEMA